MQPWQIKKFSRASVTARNSRFLDCIFSIDQNIVSRNALLPSWPPIFINDQFFSNPIEILNENCLCRQVFIFDSLQISQCIQYLPTKKIISRSRRDIFDDYIKVVDEYLIFGPKFLGGYGTTIFTNQNNY